MSRILAAWSRLSRRPLVLVVLALIAVSGLAVADPRARAALQRPFGASGLVIVPDHYLRPWDPVTVFFPTAVGPAGGGPEDHPERHVTVTPRPAGAWEWLDARTLQFRPAEPWPTLGISRWRAGGEEVELVTLMTPPIRTEPAEGATDLPPVEALTLVFANEVDPAALADVVRFELTPLDGSGPARWLGARDFVVKALPAAPAESSTDTGSAPEPMVGLPYEIRFREPIPLGTGVVAHFRLSRDDARPEGFAELRFATAEPFRVSAVGCSSGQLPLASEGTRYTAEQVQVCRTGPLAVVFTAPPDGLGPVEARNLLRFSPAVEGLGFTVSGNRLLVSGRFEAERTYTLTLTPIPVKDVSGRLLATTGPSRVFLRWARDEAFLRWGAADGIVERNGPQMLPLDGRGVDRVDLRVVKVDPLDRGFWPFPADPVSVDEGARPPGPGEEPAEVDVGARPNPEDIAARLQLLGPSISTLVDLPGAPEEGAARFGLDIARPLAAVGGAGAPGTYLVGLRNLDTSATRSWMRVQVTDLSLTAIEERGSVRFVVRSLATGQVVPGAEVRLEGVRQAATAEWATLASGRTDAAGAWTWKAPGEDRVQRPRLRRVVVQRDADVLVLDPELPPMVYTENHWGQRQEDWFGWAFAALEARSATATTLAHIFTERPVYRPEEGVHIRGWLRRRDRGTLTPVVTAGKVVVIGPDELEWSSEVSSTSATGGFYWRFHEPEAPTGSYRAHFQTSTGEVLGGVEFQVEAYRLPEFEAVLSGPQVAPLDRPFEVALTASYFAGGRVSGRPVRWRVTQFPYDWTVSSQPGFVYSTDGRWSGLEGFRATPRFEKVGKTDADGGATLALDPTIEPTASPRTYVVEATVTGADDQTVTAVRRVVSLPAFVLGLKVPRYLEQATVLRPEILVAGPDQKLLAGQEVTVRLFRRTWQSALQPGDFSAGEARYRTDVVDVPVRETVVRSGTSPTTLELPIDRAGVYVVELEARDRLGRAQVVRVDLYAGGAEAVSWPKPAAGVFTLAADRAAYDPGVTATVLVQSPFPVAEALVVVEAPGGNVYSSVPVRGGSATLRIPVEKTWVPRVPVHVVLQRGRTDAPKPSSASELDLGKPTTLASTTFLTVNPVANQLGVTVESPARALPGQTIPVTVRLRTPDGKPSAGEVALWLVDAAVLSLGKEQRLDPLPDFITPVVSRLRLRDTRNLAFGRIPFAEAVGGDSAETEEESPLDRATVRKDFQPVPYYAPALAVGADGVLRVQVKLPDNLTTFRIRAKAVAGPDRFGHGVGEVAVRLPVLVQPALPRFVRPGDSFAATGVGRVVEGPGGAGTAQIRVEGMKLTGSDKAGVTLSPTDPVTARFPVTVETPGFDADGRLVRDSVTVRMALARAADGASDAFEVRLPLRGDRTPEVERQRVSLVDGKASPIRAIAEAARPGTLTRRWVASDELGLLRLAAGLEWLERYPWGNTEARVSRARAWLAMGTLRAALGHADGDARTDRAVEGTLAWLPQVVDTSGLVADVPSGRPSVARTAWTELFLVEAREAGYAVDPALERTLVDALRQSLRSDYRFHATGEAYVERALALEALASAGTLDAAYFAELARTAQFRDAEGVAAVTLAGVRGGQGGSPAAARLVEMLSGGVVTRLWEGREIYGGLQSQRVPRSPTVLPSETRTVAAVTRALARARPDHPRVPLLVEALVGLGRDDGWGSTNTNAEAILALAERLRDRRAGAWTAEVRGGSGNFTLSPAPGAVATASTRSGEAATVTARGAALELWVETAYTPAADGASVAALSEGFVVSRTALLVRAGGPPDRVPFASPGTEVRVGLGQVIEEHVQIVAPADSTYVAVHIPLPAGVDPLNPRLATAPPEASPAGTTTRAPTWADWRDDHVTLFYEELPKGTWDVYFRTRATVPGRFVIPSATAERLYERSVRGRSAGARLVVAE